MTRHDKNGVAPRDTIMDPIMLYDTTLRDGTQGENISFTADEKLTIAQRLDDMGIHYIEGGWPGSNPRDMHFFDLAKREHFRNARLTAFGSTRRRDHRRRSRSSR